MKKKIILSLFVLIFSFGKGYSQADSCVVLGCARNFGTITTNNALPDLPGGFPGSCYAGFPFPYKQVYWQFFYSPSGGNFTQTYTPTDGAPGLDIDWVVYDIGTLPPSTISCPINKSGWTEVACNIAGNYGDPAGPGTSDGTLGTTALHYYAIGIIIYPNGAVPSPGPNFNFTVGTPQIGGINLTSANCPGVLPVRLTSFDAKVNNCIIDLNWIAANETNFKNYEVQFSTNGTNFQTLSTIPAALQNNSSSQKYSYQHNYSQQGKIYYRLKMVDLDGKFEYSKIIAMKLDCSRSTTFVYPNPVTDVLNVNITNAQNNITYANLFDSYGKQVYTGIMVSGTNTINMATFAKGVYLLILKNNSETQNIKIIK